MWETEQFWGTIDFHSGFFPTMEVNDKPWFTSKLRQLRQAKEDAYRKGDKVLYKLDKYTLEKEIWVAEELFR